MKKIFTTFSQLVEANKGLFSVVTKSNQLGTYEAVWNARNAEIEKLKEDVAALEVSRAMDEKRIADLEQENKGYLEELDQLGSIEYQRRELAGQYDQVLGENNSIKKKAYKQTLELQKTISECEVLKANLDQQKAQVELSELERQELEYNLDEALTTICSLEKKVNELNEDKVSLNERISYHKDCQEKVQLENRKFIKRAKQDYEKLTILDKELCKMESKEKAYKQELAQAYEKIDYIQSYVAQFSKIFSQEKKSRGTQAEVTQ